MSEPYDPYLPRGGSSSNPSGEPARGQGNAKTAAIQAQFDDMVAILRENIIKVAERGERLDSLGETGGFASVREGLGSLQDKADKLAVSVEEFRRGANKVRKNMW
ncbi:hypothetical protein JB92DRAFT_2907175 [Gautieria morchelliformis]|nr:hypothetical protein JB92DRAFT_2907175 [Gautieria morchelliformis]